jgi:putative flippase GtrA
MFSPPPSVPCFASPLSVSAEHFPRLRSTSTCLPAEALGSRVLAFLRPLLVALWAGALDLGLLTLCIHWLGCPPLGSRAMAIVVSGVVAFLGNRSFAFRAHAGNVPQQARRFALAELLALPLNLLAFRLCGHYAPAEAPEVVSLVAGAFVFVSFSYPMRRWFVFQTARAVDHIASSRRSPVETRGAAR